jgi:hypothetical protein
MRRALEKFTDAKIMQEAASRLAKQYGAISVNGTQIEFHDTPRPPESVIAAARDGAIHALNAALIKDVCLMRIVAVTKDTFTEINMLAHVTSLRVKGESNEHTDIVMWQSIAEWIAATQAACRVLIENDDPTYKDSGRWPKPPDGARDFANRF